MLARRARSLAAAALLLMRLTIDALFSIPASPAQMCADRPAPRFVAGQRRAEVASLQLRGCLCAAARPASAFSRPSRRHSQMRESKRDEPPDSQRRRLRGNGSRLLSVLRPSDAQSHCLDEDARNPSSCDSPRMWSRACLAVALDNRTQ
jgi:hypothetical protein